MSRFILVQAPNASNTQDNIQNFFDYEGQISVLAEGDSVDELEEC